MCTLDNVNLHDLSLPIRNITPNQFYESSRSENANSIIGMHERHNKHLFHVLWQGQTLWRNSKLHYDSVRSRWKYAVPYSRFKVRFYFYADGIFMISLSGFENGPAQSWRKQYLNVFNVLTLFFFFLIGIYQ